MALLHIYTFPDEVLHTRAAPVEPTPEELAELKALSVDMLETMYESPGIGLAANQVGVLKRIIVVDTDYTLEEGPEGEEVILNKSPLVLINPEILEREGEIIYCEGCLSVPDFTADVKRSNRIKIRYMDLEGKPRELEAEDVKAVCIQHEMDHLDGRLFIDRLSPAKKDLARKKLLRDRKARELQAERALRGEGE